jgi:hypothetical protein
MIAILAYKEIKNIAGNIKLMLGLLFLTVIFFLTYMAKQPGIYILILHSVTMAWSISATSFLEEKNEETLTTLLSGPCTLFSLWMAKVTVFTICCFIISIFLFVFSNSVNQSLSLHNCIMLAIWPVWLFFLIGIYGVILLISLNRLMALFTASLFSVFSLILFFSLSLPLNIIVSLVLALIISFLASNINKEHVILGVAK